MRLAHNLSRREKVLLWVLAFLLSVTAAYIYVHDPFVKQVLALDAEIQQLALQIREARGPYRDLPETEARIAAVEEEIAALRELLPAQLDLGAFLLAMYEAEARTGARVTGLEPGPVLKSKDYTKLSFECSVVAPSYQTLYRFMASLEDERTHRPIIERLNAKTVSSARPGAAVEAVVTIVFYRSP